MLRVLMFLLLATVAVTGGAQTSYFEDMQDYRDGYKESLLQGGHALKPEDAGYLRFFDINPDYQVTATFVIVTGTPPFLAKTEHGGVRKPIREYGYVYFNLKGAPITLTVYRFLDMENNPALSDHLFIPFTDRTNYKETFQGGRYLDLSIKDIKDNMVILDFNKCYNPHTAYQKGYPYIIPPVVNNLRVDIKAGEKIFGHNPGY